MEQAAQQAVSPTTAVLDGAAAAAPALAATAAATAGGASATAWGLLLALAAAAGNNIGKGLQKAATRGLPALTLARKEVIRACCMQCECSSCEAPNIVRVQAMLVVN
jgi:hypothetical protein